LAALAIFHALPSGQLRILKTTDLHDGRLFLANRTVLLADPVRARLAAYLDYRNLRWPRTANPHLFVSQVTGCGVEPVSYVWINDVSRHAHQPAAGGPPTPRGRGHRRRPPPHLRLVRASAEPCATPALSTSPDSSNTTSAMPVFRTNGAASKAVPLTGRGRFRVRWPCLRWW
jgi:hypothetical protein